MKTLLQASQDERALYFQQAAARSEKIKNANIIEKDFWVCWTLDKIFSDTTLSPHITFKGGTSLSKCYSIIDRFSEDCDLTLSKKYIGITNDNDPISAATSNQRNKRLDQLAEAVKNKIIRDVKPLLTTLFRDKISDYFADTEWKLETDDTDEQTLLFHYPSSFEKNPDGYIQSVVKLEFGARGDNSPSESKTISPYAQQLLPELFNTSSLIKVTSLTAKRTFWEKVTLLHAEYHRDPQKPLPNRMFRHYYDIVMLDKKNLTVDALQDAPLLDDVVKNKMIYFPSRWANYEKAKIGSLHLFPNEKFINSLRQDCNRMSEMFFGEPPIFDNIMSEIARIEVIINSK
jgi:hypothetical protein